MNEINSPLVSIRCTAYNHEKYIRDTLEGFVMQKTNFKFEAIIHDDASTDNTAAIIREYAEKYPDIIKPIFETENQYSKHDGSLARIVNNACKGKYIALCEGDDYWIDPLKLQKQVDILEDNPNITMVYTNFSVVNELGIKIPDVRYERLKQKSQSGNIFQSLLENGNFVMTLTTMFRREVIFNPILLNSPVQLDYLYILVAAGMGDLSYIPDITSCYRISPYGQMSTNLKGVKKATDSIRFYIGSCYIEGKFKPQPSKEDSKIKQQYINDAFTLYRKNIDRNSLPNILKRHPYLYIQLIYIIIKKLIDLIKKRS